VLLANTKFALDNVPLRENQLLNYDRTVHASETWK
jgi:hypothetical protein